MMSKTQRFEDLRCWQEARALAKAIFQLEGPLIRDWSSRDQFRRAGLSVMNNTSEGYGRFSDRDFCRFLKIAHASANEVKSMLYLFENIGYFTSNELTPFHKQVEKTKALLLAFIKHLSKPS